MTRHPVTVRSRAPFKDLVRVLLDGDLSAVPVVDEAHRVVGAVTEADLLPWEAALPDPGVGA
jgi:CBS-domain-containing membrane protein